MDEIAEIGQYCDNCHSYPNYCDCIGCAECGTEGKVKVISTVRLPAELPSRDSWLKKLFKGKI